MLPLVDHLRLLHEAKSLYDGLLFIQFQLLRHLHQVDRFPVAGQLAARTVAPEKNDVGMNQNVIDNTFISTLRAEIFHPFKFHHSHRSRILN